MPARKTAAPKKKAGAGKKPASKKKSGGKGELRIRMYRVGFGDFFLMTVPSANGPLHVLVDCGVTKGKTGKGEIGTIKAAVRHMAKETGGHLALIIATHRHQDHIIGFSRCGDLFEKFKVDAVWMSHWETEYVAEVVKFQEELSSLAMGLQQNLMLRGTKDETTEAILGMLENATGVSATEGPGGGTNAKSLALLKKGLGVEPAYLHRGQKAPLPPSLVAAGLEAEILGPPPSDALAFMKLMDLKKGVGQFLDAAAADGEQAERLSPFGRAYHCGPDDYPPSAFREWKAPSRMEAAARLEEAIAKAQPAALLVAAEQLDDFLNNQSLVVLFTFKGKRLLFAGDAQAGNWEFWLYDLDKPSKTPGDTLGAEGADVLKNVDFYKVGHHGSTNATPIAAVGGLSDGFAAMCSTQEDSFGSVAKGSEVPRIPLLDALDLKCKIVVRSDHFPFDHDGKKVAAVPGGPKTLPKPARGGRFVVGSCFVDYLL